MEFRKVKDIDVDLFSSEITKSKLVTEPSENIDELVNQYNETLTALLDKFAPVTEREVVLRPTTPWYTDKIGAAKRERRKAEQRWLATRLTVYKEILSNHKNKVKTLCIEAKKEYYKNKIADASDSKSLFRITDSLLKKQQDKTLPDS